jgi:hypothetical protein
MSKKEEAAKLFKGLKELDDEWKQKAKKIKKAGSEEAKELQILYLRKMALLLKEAEYIEKDAELHDVKITPFHILSDLPELEVGEIGKTSSKQFTNDGLTAMTITFEDSYVTVAWREKKE